MDPKDGCTDRDALSKSFSHGSSMERAKVDSNHILRRQKKTPSFEAGFLVNEWSGFAGGRYAGGASADGMVVRVQVRRPKSITPPTQSGKSEYGRINIIKLEKSMLLRYIEDQSSFQPTVWHEIRYCLC
jgi:hypothetical protein